MCSIKKYKFVIYDRFNDIKYEIYSNRKLSKKQKLIYIRYHIYKNNFKIPPPDSKVLIICND